MGGFIRDVQSLGLVQTLRDRGLGSLVNRPLREVVDGILSTLTERTGFIEETDALTAAGRVLDRVREGCPGLEEFERKLGDLADVRLLAALLGDFFRFFLVEDFIRHYWRELQKKYSNGQINDFRRKVEELLFERLNLELDYRDLSTVDWSSRESVELVQRIERETFDLCIEVTV